MELLTWIIIGLLAGWLAGLVMRGRGYGIIGDIVLGVVGALVGGFLATRVLGLHYAVNGINLGTIIIAFLGAVVVVAVTRLVTGRSPI